ncbi:MULTISPECIES: response regulator transcription factor [unclassified Paenibacillus]|uniref:response regulator transcription factor n=1 Tax=unclassified Paenibacillus TaxID=185978 RepID=UPI002406C3AB|nr:MULTISPECIES: response regulator transcription factor [unclassified Paenibacillus]MDF9839181.1 two-component system OmpR family response regulator [Paenibacillus sp. PastF-2]MDF9845763.1 two-component system OmpR family response regulator [Paenibacillus sp. PastM-2]MDF9852335.1 two-component system OmpR family response regulator [Paenibacillus sp. PastF-1]MDH6477935.1 two-component system OmpR family response regulator [Paenibacillus sp. PastH-2]MDH6505673.1 two-component system OmpR family
MKRILVADDDMNIRTLLRHVLLREGYAVTEAENGLQAAELMKASTVDLAVVDVMMPQMDGLELCQYIRETYDIPIILLTARQQLSDKEQGYLRGTDDYVTKPFEPEELVFRIKALFRRYSIASDDKIRLNSILIDRKNYEISDGNEVLLLPVKEFELLAQLAQYPGRLFSRSELIELVWGADYEGDERTVDVHIKRLRQRFADYQNDFVIRTVRGIGYKVDMVNG